MRKLASVQEIAEIQSIPEADAIVAVRVNDWWCVAKKGEFNVGDKCVYFEIDSLLPMTETFSFLASRGTKKTQLDDNTIVEGYRLKTARMRGQLSQGLALPISVFPELGDPALDSDVTETLGVHKYERIENAPRSAEARGNFPSFLVKSDQERCQNLRRSIWDSYCADDVFQVTVKLDGSSLTAFDIRDEQAEKWGTEPRIGVCSRNLELKESEDNAFWKIVLQSRDTLLPALHNMAVQGELVAPNIQSNFEGVLKPTLFIYNMYDITKQEWVSPDLTEEFCQRNGLSHVPVLHRSVTLRQLFPDATQDTIVSQLLTYAEGPSSLNGKTREGLVYKRLDGKFSFKTISNLYLTKYEK